MTSPLGARLLAVFASVGMLAGLGACTTGGTAVQSLGVTYTESDVTVVADELAEIVGETSFSRQDAVGMLTQVQPLFAVGEAQGMDLSEESLSQSAQFFLDNIGSDVDVETLSAATEQVLASVGVSSALAPVFQSNQQIVQEIMALMSPPNTTVNPRYLSVTPDGIQAPSLLGDVVPVAAETPLFIP